MGQEEEPRICSLFYPERLKLAGDETMSYPEGAPFGNLSREDQWACVQQQRPGCVDSGSRSSSSSQLTANKDASLIVKEKEDEEEERREEVRDLRNLRADQGKRHDHGRQ